MTGCCDPGDCHGVFTRRLARRVARRYRKHGLSPTAQRIVGFLVDHGIEDASVLEIGGGIGELQLELLRRGAANVTNLEISTNYEVEAARLLHQSGIADRVSRRFLDIARAPDEVELADVVVLHRVVCCYPDHQALLSAAASHAKRLLVWSHPADTAVTRVAFWTENFLRSLRGNNFRVYVHPPESMVAVAECDGMSTSYRHRSRQWEVVGMVRRELTAGPVQHPGIG